MKKLFIILSALALLASSAFARHMLPHENEEITAPKSSPQLSMTFY